MMFYVKTRIAALAFALSFAPAWAAPVSTAITYQGQIKQGGVPVSQTCDFEFTLWDDPVATLVANQVGPTLIFDGGAGNSPPVGVVNGLFTVALDFGSGAFNGDARWLQIDVCCSSPCASAFTTLSPRQPLTATPYALKTRGIFVDDAGNVGIGTTAPVGKLHIASAGQLAIDVGSTNAFFGSFAIPGGALYGFSKPGVVQLAINVDSGNVGIGTGISTPQRTLHVVGSGVLSQVNSTLGIGVKGVVTTSSGPTFGVLGESVSTSGTGVNGKATASSGSTFGVVGESFSTSGRGVYGKASATSGAAEGVLGETLSPNGLGVLSVGDFGATGTKSFIQPHPSDASKEIRFVSLEGNESGTYFRGSANLTSGRAVIDVPEEFRLVSELDGLTVQVTALGPNAGLWVESKGLAQIVVRGNGNVKFDYFVNGVRRGFANHVAIRENHAYVPEVRGIPYGTQYREGQRRILVENGILNPDFTPNEQKAGEMGWILRAPTSKELSRHKAARDTDQGTTR